MSLSDYSTMETTKETIQLEPFLTSYEKMPLELVDAVDVLTTEPEQNQMGTELYYSVVLPVEDSIPQTYVDITLPSETTEEPHSESFFQTIKEEITTFLSIQKVEAENTLPFIEIRKENVDAKKEK